MGKYAPDARISLLLPPEPCLQATWSPGDVTNTMKGNSWRECGQQIPKAQRSLYHLWCALSSRMAR